MFGLFGSKKRKESISDLLVEFAAYQKLLGSITKIQSLQKLERDDEARQVGLEAEKLANSYLVENPREKKAHMMLALFYQEVGRTNDAEPIISLLLSSGQFQLDDDERLILSGALQKIQRQRPLSERAVNTAIGYTQIYSCANCGRLHNFVSMPCPNCDWAPQTIDETARSIILSNSHFKVPVMLAFAREINNGRDARDVVPNLVSDGKTCLADPKQKQGVEKIFSLLRENEHKNHRSLSMVRECGNCGHRIFFSGAEECEECQEPVNWPDAIRTLACMDNLLWLFEVRVEPSSSDAFSDFVCLLVGMTNNLLRKQEAPLPFERQYSLKLLAEMGGISDLNQGAVIETKDPNELKIYLVKANMREDSESFGLLLYRELEIFIGKMAVGVKL